jgi:hypothetical protein
MLNRGNGGAAVFHKTATTPRLDLLATVKANLRTCVNREQPFETADSEAVTVTTLGLEYTL